MTAPILFLSHAHAPRRSPDAGEVGELDDASAPERLTTTDAKPSPTIPRDATASSRSMPTGEPDSVAGSTEPGKRKGGGAPRRRGMPARLGLKRLEQGPVALKIAAVVWFGHWLYGVVAGILAGHWTPGEVSTSQAQFIALLVVSLGTFTCAVIASIELFKLTRGGRSVGVALGGVNVVVALLGVLYSQNWVGLIGHVIFALALLRLCTGRTTRPRLAVGLALALLAGVVQIAPVVVYRSGLETAQDQMKEKEYAAASDTWARTQVLSGVVGEKPRTKALIRVNHGYSVALAGRPAEGYRLVLDSFRFATTQEAYTAKAEIYCMIHGIPYEEREEIDLDEAAVGEIERRDAQRNQGPLDPNDPALRWMQGNYNGADSSENDGSILPD